MHDIWNPWHGCIKKSEGCQNCYMMYLDKIHQNKEKGIFKTAMLEYPLKKNRDGSFKIKSGELIRVCMTSDFFLEEADKWRNNVWKVIKKRSDVIFYILTSYRYLFFLNFSFSLWKSLSFQPKSIFFPDLTRTFSQPNVYFFRT